MARSQRSKAASQSDHAAAPSQADAPPSANVPAPATAPAPPQLALFSTLASTARLLLEALGSRDLKADNHFTLETLRRAILVSEPYIEIVLHELERHEISAEAGPSSRTSHRDAKSTSKSKSKSKSQGLLKYLPKLISIASQLAKTREKRPNGSVRLTLLQELHEFLKVEMKAARKEVKRLEHVLEGKHKRRRHRRHRAEKGRDGGGEGKKMIAAGGGGEKDEGGNEDGDGGGGEDDDEDGSGDDGDGDDDGAPLLRRGPASLNEATSNREERRSAGPSGDDESSQHNDDLALVIRVQSPSTHRSERVSSRASSMAASKSSRSGSHHTGRIAPKTPSSRHIIEEAPSAARSRSRSTQRTERSSSPKGPIEIPPSPHPASSHPRSSVSRRSSSRHIVKEPSAVKSQSYSTQESRRVSNSTASELASSPLHPGSDHTKSIASRCLLKQHVVDQAPAARSQCRSTQRMDVGSKRNGSVKAAPSSHHESIGPTLVMSKDLSSRQVVDQARSRSPSEQRSERAGSRTSPNTVPTSSRRANNDARSIVSKASSSRHVVKQEPISRSRSPSTQGAEKIMSRTDSVHRAGGVSKTIASRASSSSHIVDQSSVTGIQSPDPETKERLSNLSSSGRDASDLSRDVSPRALSSRQVVDKAPAIKMQSQNTQERMNDTTDSVHRTSNNSTSASSKASSSHHSRVTRAPTVSTTSSRSSSPSSTVANVDDSKAQRSRPGSDTQGSTNRAPQSRHSSAQSGSKVPSPAPPEQHTAFPKGERSNKASSHESEKKKPSLVLSISDLQDGTWTFQQLPISND